METMSPSTPGINPRDPYTTLGVPSGTPFHEVKVVYRRLVRDLHPDVNPDDPLARERFDAVQAAFAVLRAQHAAARHASPGVGAHPESPQSSPSPAPLAEMPVDLAPRGMVPMPTVPADEASQHPDVDGSAPASAATQARAPREPVTMPRESFRTGPLPKEVPAERARRRAASHAPCAHRAAATFGCVSSRFCAAA